ncbi:Protein FORGETTER 1 [Camellia lanceoleosa]|uniref:Protein FORGETTER 1 n=1 Tax=Camellia lanceoleosa TaxID=1840588 RepID=A0ACC0I970_9ERIC|nr:Protein FORGETTER 1 [Camellia lanceoleosa]
MGGGEGGDEAVDEVLGGGGPGVVADVPPELLVGGDSVEVGRRTGCGGDCWAVESGEDVDIPPCCGEAVREMPLAEPKNKYIKVSSLEKAHSGWEDEYEVSSKQS